MAFEYDVFISHASEDKDDIVRPLAKSLESVGAKVWLDENEIGWGDSILSKVQEGLLKSRYGLVVLSPRFFEKKWTTDELKALFQLGSDNERKILPLYHQTTPEDIQRTYPLLADKLGLFTSSGLEDIANRFRPLVSTNDPGSEFGLDASRAIPGNRGHELLGRAKKHLQSLSMIDLYDLLHDEVDHVVRMLTQIESTTLERSRDMEKYFNDVRNRVKGYEVAIEGLNGIQMAIAFFSREGTANAPLRRSLASLLERVTSPEGQTQVEQSGLSNLKRLPAIVSFHRTAVAALEAENWEVLRMLLSDMYVLSEPFSPIRSPMLYEIAPRKLTFHTGLEHWLLGEKFEADRIVRRAEERYLSDKAVEGLKWFRVNQRDTEDTFDKWLFLGQMAISDAPEGTYTHAYFSTGIVSRLRRNYAWGSTPPGRLMAQVQRDQDQSPILRTGIGGGDWRKFLNVAHRVKSDFIDPDWNGT